MEEAAGELESRDDDEGDSDAVDWTDDEGANPDMESGPQAIDP